MAKTIATIGGVALRPGVSRNKRLYTAPMIAKAVEGVQARIRAGDPPVLLTHHDAGDDSARIVGRLTSMTVGEDGSARFTAALADTRAGRDIASLVDTTAGKPHLKGVSIRGYWTGKVRKVRGTDGEAETADGIELAGVDFTASPGVAGAGVDTFAWAAPGGTAEASRRRALICESVEEARMTVTGTAYDRAYRKALRKQARRLIAREAAASRARLEALADAKIREALGVVRLVDSIASGSGDNATALRESSNRDLAAIAAAAMTARGVRVPETRGAAVPGARALLESVVSDGPASAVLQAASPQDLAALASAALTAGTGSRGPAPFRRTGAAR